MAGALRGFERPGPSSCSSCYWRLVAGSGAAAHRPFIEAANRLGYTSTPFDVAGSEPSLSNLLDPWPGPTGGQGGDRRGGAVLADVAKDSSTYYGLGFDANFRADDNGTTSTS